MTDQFRDAPINTLEDAKEFFLYMDCSHFNMGREYPERYEEYERLHISEHMETEWRRERFNEICSRIMDRPNGDPLWLIHSQLYDLYEELRGEEELMKILEVTRTIRDMLPMDDRVIVAETINGRGRRQDREGLIYMAYDSGNIAAAREFVELSLELSSYNTASKWNFWDKKKARHQRATALCQEIMNELGLKQYA